MSGALRRMGFEKSVIAGHGFRAMARTILDEVSQVRPEGWREGNTYCQGAAYWLLTKDRHLPDVSAGKYLDSVLK